MKFENAAVVLIIEDEAGLARALQTACEQMGHHCRTAANARTGLDLAKSLAGSLQLVILDIGLPDRSGLELLPALRDALPGVPVLIITAHGSLQNAVAARRQGAADYLVKPLDLSVFEQTVTSLLKSRPDRAAPARGNAGEPVLAGSSRAMQPVFKAIAIACASSSPVLLRGSSGSGKTLAAHVIHRHSERAGGPFVTLACGEVPGMSVAEETALLVQADNGTLLLDEVSDMPPEAQARLLRFVEEKVVSQPGETPARRLNVRLIAATQRDPAAEVAAGRFRKDLYFRLNVIEIVLPPLRQRMEDIPVLAEHLLERIAPGRGLHLAPETLAKLRTYDWPGHVRELRNCLEHAAAQSAGTWLLPPHLPATLRGGPDTATLDRRLDTALANWAGARLKETGVTYDAMHDELEGRLLAALLPHFDNRPTRLAAALNMNRNTLRKRLGRDHPADGKDP